MGIAKLKYLGFVLALYVCVLDPTWGQDIQIQTPLVNLAKQRLFVFGDSAYDPGNHFYLYGNSAMMYLPYGTAFFVPTGRNCDGLMVPDYISLFANISTSITPYFKPGADISDFTSGANFACTGAPVYGDDEMTVGLREQVANFMKLADLYVQQYGESDANTLMSRSVFLISIGTVDYINLMMPGPKDPEPPAPQQDECVNFVISNLTSVITDLYNRGGRRFAFDNVGPLGCQPTVKRMKKLGKDACYEPFNEICKKHNAALPKALEDLKSKLQGLEYVVFDLYKELLGLIQTPADYDFKEGDVACCGSGPNRAGACGFVPYEICPVPDEHVFFDGGHLTQHANFILSFLMYYEPNSTIPYPIENLFLLP